MILELLAQGLAMEIHVPSAAAVNAICNRTPCIKYLSKVCIALMLIGCY